MKTIKTKIGLERHLQSVIGNALKYYTDYPDTIFTINGHEIARWNYDDDNYTILDKIYFED